MNIPVEIILTRRAINSYCYYGAALTAIDFQDNDCRITSLTLQLKRIKICPDIASDLETIYKPFDVAYYNWICEQAATLTGVQRKFGHSKTMSENVE